MFKNRTAAFWDGVTMVRTYGESRTTPLREAGIDLCKVLTAFPICLLWAYTSWGRVEDSVERGGSGPVHSILSAFLFPKKVTSLLFAGQQTASTWPLNNHHHHHPLHLFSYLNFWKDINKAKSKALAFRRGQSLTPTMLVSPLAVTYTSPSFLVKQCCLRVGHWERRHYLYMYIYKRVYM